MPNDGEEHHSESPAEIRISPFECSVENHLLAIDTISRLCGEPQIDDSDQLEIQRFASSSTFLREWKYFNYEPRIINFACQNESLQGKDLVGSVKLSQFSSVSVPKKAADTEKISSTECSEDFVLYVGGQIWALDWCPRVNQDSDSLIKSEFLAVAAHPPQSSYHNLGACLTGRGVIQIWCLLSISTEENVHPHVQNELKRNSRKSETEQAKSAGSERPRGRPRKKPIHETSDIGHGNDHNLWAPDKTIVSSNDKRLTEKERTEEEVDDSGVPPLSSRKREIDGEKQKRPRGRPRKKEMRGNSEKRENNNLELGAIQYPEDTFNLLPIDVASENLEKESSREKEVNKSASLDKMLNPSEFNRLTDKGRQRTQIHDSAVSLLTSITSETDGTKLARTKRPGRQPRKKPLHESSDKGEYNVHDVQPLAIEYPEDSSTLLPLDVAPGTVCNDDLTKDSGMGQELKPPSSGDKILTYSKRRKLKQSGSHVQNMLTQNESGESPIIYSQAPASRVLDCLPSGANGTYLRSCNAKTEKPALPEDVALPRMMLCLAHNGKVAWDVKWRPLDVSDSESKHRMGYLAVLLGNGALEVWEIPCPRTVKAIYPAGRKDGTDPRFMKLEPVLRCSRLKCGDRQSIPLTVEWSASPPHDTILAGCHDGVVALWKFSCSGSSQEKRPLLCFTADTVPIRALAWAPVGSDSESANVIVTAGHKGLKFWDIRDPYRPLWDFNPVQRIIYSLDWLPDPRCLIVSYDDGTLRILSLAKAACDVPVTGKTFVGTQQQGFHSYYCSPFAIWSVQASRLTGMVAYCGADGTALRFQLTNRAVERDPLRNRAPHFLCGSLVEEESTVEIVTPRPGAPFPMKRSLNQWGDAPRTMRGFMSVSNQEKRAKEQMSIVQMSDEQILAEYGKSDIGSEVGAGDQVVAQKGKQAPKSKSSGKTKSKANQQALMCLDDEVEIHQQGAEQRETAHEIDVFPPKVVAMHRVRWNMNKGSEKWLCYGGAAGLVRCQQVI